MSPGPTTGGYDSEFAAQPRAVRTISGAAATAMAASVSTSASVWKADLEGLARCFTARELSPGWWRIFPEETFVVACVMFAERLLFGF